MDMKSRRECISRNIDKGVGLHAAGPDPCHMINEMATTRTFRGT